MRNKLLGPLFLLIALMLVILFPAPVFLQQVKAQEDSLVFLSLGDELVSGYISNLNPVSTFASLLDADFKTQFNSTVYYSEGVTGMTSTDLVTRLSNTTLRARIRAADQIVLSTGWRDIYTVVQSNVAAFNVGTLTEANFRVLLNNASNNFAENLPIIVKEMEELTKSNTLISLPTVVNTFRGVTTRSLGTIVNQYIEIINSVIRGVNSFKVEVVDVKAYFDALSSAQHLALVDSSGTPPVYLVNNAGQTEIYNVMKANMQVFQAGFSFGITLLHAGNLKQIFSQEMPVVFTLHLYEGVLVSGTYSWYVDGVLVQQSTLDTFTFTPNREGDFVVSAYADSYMATEIISVSYLEIDFLSLDFNGLLYQDLQALQPITFFVAIPTVDPTVPIVWTVDGNAVTPESDGVSFVFTPSEVGNYVIRVERDGLFSEKTVQIVYAPVSDFLMEVDGALQQTLGATSMVNFDLVIPEFSDPNSAVQWFVNGEEQPDSQSSFSFEAPGIGDYEIKAKIGIIEKIKTVMVSYAPIEDFVLVAEGELEQMLNYLTTVNFSFTLPQNTDPNTVAQWSVNNVRRSQLSQVFSYMPTVVGSYTIEAKIGSVVKEATIILNYLPIELEEQVLGYNGSLAQYTIDLQPILFSVDVSTYSNASEVRWYVNNQLMQTVGKEFWFQPAPPTDGAEKTYYLIEARLQDGQVSRTLIVSVFRGGNKPLDFFGILFIVLASLALLLAFYFVYNRIRNRNLIV